MLAIGRTILKQLNLLEVDSETEITLGEKKSPLMGGSELLAYGTIRKLVAAAAVTLPYKSMA